ncbi:type ISP restriction/modification enzyme [Bartonella sp. B12(2025)]
MYGLLHSEGYREYYADNRIKQLLRISRVKSFDDFTTFTQADRDLTALHLNYETISLFL